MGKKIFVLGLIILGGVSLFQISKSYAEVKFSTLECVIVSEDPIRGSMQQKLLLKGKKVRLEMETPGAVDMSMVTFSNGEKAYMYFPSQNLAMSVPLARAQPQVPMTADSLQPDKRLVGQETIDNRLCDIYEYTDPQGKIYKIWVARDIEFLTKVAVDGMTIHYRNIKVNMPLDDSLFEIPPGAQVQDMAEGMQQPQGLQ